MAPQASKHASRWSSVGPLLVLVTAVSTATVVVVSRTAGPAQPQWILAVTLGILVSAIAGTAFLVYRVAQRELETLDARVAELESTLEAQAGLPAPPAPEIALQPPGNEPSGVQDLRDGFDELRDVSAASPETPQGSAGPGAKDQSPPELSILLAEDNPVNQEVALLMLHRLGHRADVAGNGLEVLEALARRTYDVILMDVQMPAMDGLEAARQVRRRYRGEKRPRIIALTAHADRAHCLDAGMDDYLSKPIHKEALATVLSIAADPSSAFTIGGLTETESIDKDRLALLRNLRTKTQTSLLAQIIDLFFESSTEDFSNLREAVQTGDWPTLRAAAHSLLGSSSDLGLTAVSDICLELKQMSPESPPEALHDAVDRMERHLGRARKALERMRSLS